MMITDPTVLVADRGGKHRTSNLATWTPILEHRTGTRVLPGTVSSSVTARGDSKCYGGSYRLYWR